MSHGLIPWALATGSAAALNPCGFAVLPAYVAYQLGADAGTARARKVIHGIGRGVAMTGGIVTLFAVVGGAVGLARAVIVPVLPYAAMLVGVVLAVGGGVLLARRGALAEIPVPLAGKFAPRGPAGRAWTATYLFGIGYGTASLGCTLPIFLAIASQSLATRSPVDTLAVIVAYGAGMGWLVMLVAVATALGSTVIVQGLRPLVRWVHDAGAVGMVISGIYLVYYYRGVLGIRL